MFNQPQQTIPLSNTFEMHTHAPSGYPLPIAFSMPFAQGQLTDTTHIQILKDQQAVPAQFQALNRWPDGTLKWVQGIAPITGTFVVQHNAEPTPTSITNPVQATSNNTTASLTDTHSTLTVNLQTCIATFTHNEQTLIFSLSQLTDQNNTVFQAQNATATVIENGPLRGRIRIQGQHHNNTDTCLQFDVFISLYAGIPILEITHVLGINNNDDSEFYAFASLDMPITLNNAQIKDVQALTTENTSCTISINNRLFQYEDHQFDITDAQHAPQITGNRATGTFIAHTDVGDLFFTLPDFWQQYPKGLTANSNGLTLELFPKLNAQKKGQYANRENEHIWYYYLRDDVYTLRQGIEKSHSFYMGFGQGTTWNDQTFTALQTLPVTFPDFDYLVNTNAVGKLIAPNTTFAEWDNLFCEGFENYIQKLKEERWYGLLNWGDWFGERIHNWGNLEYDAPTSFFMQALRFQNPTYFRQAVQSARHYIDIDTISHHHNPEAVGRVWAHSLGHTGGYYEAGTFEINNYDMSDKIFHTGRSSPGHTRCEGVSLLYLLTGDPRALEHTHKIATNLTTHPLVTIGKPWGTTAREPGWAMVSLTAAFDCTGDRTYLNAAEKVADLVLKMANGKGVWHRPLASRNCMYLKHPNHERCLGELSFPIAFQSAGMIRVYERTGRTDIKDNIIAAAQYVMNNIYDPQQKGFMHSPCPLRQQSRKVGGITGTNMWIPLAFAVHETGDKNMQQAIQDTWAETKKRNAWFDGYPTEPPQRFTGTLLFMPMMQAYMDQSVSNITGT